MQSEDLAIFLDIATEAALSAGGIIEESWGKLHKVIQKGRIGDLVTEVDTQAEVAILEIIQRHFPDHSILAEESGQIDKNNRKYLWAIDPLDGTTNYAHGYPVAAVSIGLLIEGIPKVGVVYNPFRRELFRGATDLGATCNRRPIQVSSTATLAESLLVSGFAYDRRETSDNNYAEFCYLTHLTQGVRRSGSAALDLTDVACGRVDGYWERGIRPWDIAAGIVIVEEAGGKVSAYDQKPLSLESGRILATNGHVHPFLSQALIETPPLSQWES
ncbi:inositol monophosphatase family protein [Gloeocapsa sp. PCC 73106]|uniref:inositol monophosphatase family protein n=1 Tax=Gloeocapsa sp. PCC 73106 TaxID=102232 RepID=UPI0002ABCDA6|nr:inositol monophosphatase family protein [Gloeocapsa sp. PCC 73106]ELR98419.1 inositol monophosphatase/fructose-1,6-bisphosphatase family protein [Gloeocapsa sp. PCC 73106]